MKLNTKLGAALAAAGTMIAVPAAALAGPPSNSGSNHSNSGKSQTHVCKVHNRGYVEGGTVSAVTTDSTGAVTSFTITVTHKNHAAKLNPTNSVTLSEVKVVRYDGGTTAITTGERVQLIGKVTFVAKKCTDTTGAGMVTIGKVVVHPAPTPAG